MAGRPKKVTKKTTKGSTVRKCVKKCSKKTTRRKALGIDEAKLNQMIRERAYYIWEERGKPHGYDQDIWFEAGVDMRKKVTVRA